MGLLKRPLQEWNVALGQSSKSDEMLTVGRRLLPVLTELSKNDPMSPSIHPICP
jgi:hypothetical protein